MKKIILFCSNFFILNINLVQFASAPCAVFPWQKKGRTATEKLMRIEAQQRRDGKAFLSKTSWQSNREEWEEFEKTSKSAREKTAAFKILQELRANEILPPPLKIPDVPSHEETIFEKNWRS